MTVTVRSMSRLVLALAVMGCGGNARLEGKYVSDLGQYVELKDGGKAELFLNFIATEADYQVRENRVVFTNPGGTLVAHVTETGCLEFGLVGTLCKALTDSVSRR